jgi:hypothetical protein
VTHEKNGWKISTRYPVKDMVVVASKNLKSLEVVQARLPVVVQYQAITDLTAREIADEVSALVQLYEGWFGGDRKTGVTILQSMREKGGGYARRGFISLGGLSDEKYRSNHAGYLRYFAHEISHLWWNMAPSDSWEDWLNEGFAEYSALLVVKRRLGEEAFIERLQMKKQRASGAFPIRGFERGDNSTPEKRAAIENTLYHKAPLLLHRLHQRLGDKRFYSLCRSMVAGGISNTADFIRILETVSDVKTSAWFNTLLGE